MKCVYISKEEIRVKPSKKNHWSIEELGKTRCLGFGSAALERDLLPDTASIGDRSPSGVGSYLLRTPGCLIRLLFAGIENVSMVCLVLTQESRALSTAAHQGGWLWPATRRSLRNSFFQWRVLPFPLMLNVRIFLGRLWSWWWGSRFRRPFSPRANAPLFGWTWCYVAHSPERGRR